MRIALGADHAGFALKEDIKKTLAEFGLTVEDFGTGSTDSVDYPDFAERVARGVAGGQFDRGILVCGTGIGMAIAANKIPGIRAATVTDVEMARLSREHNDANVLAIGGRLLDKKRALEIVRTFLETPFGGDRHQRRLDKIKDLESRT
jgi:ribose 5-phosphate isomerase B